MIVAGSALFISACALLISVQEVRIMRTQQKASMYPYITVDQIYNGKGFGFRLRNSGNGLAKINSYQVYNDSLYFKEWMDVAQTLAPHITGINYDIIGTVGDIKNQMITPGESINLIFLQWTPETREMEKYMNGLKISVCYSSLLEEHWQVQDGIPNEIDTPCVLDTGKEFGL